MQIELTQPTEVKRQNRIALWTRLQWYNRFRRVAQPKDWWIYHHAECGTKYRGCHPTQCPKENFERTGVWCRNYPDLIAKGKGE